MRVTVKVCVHDSAYSLTVHAVSPIQPNKASFSGYTEAHELFHEKTITEIFVCLTEDCLQSRIPSIREE